MFPLRFVVRNSVGSSGIEGTISLFDYLQQLQQAWKFYKANWNAAIVVTYSETALKIEYKNGTNRILLKVGDKFMFIFLMQKIGMVFITLQW